MTGRRVDSNFVFVRVAASFDPPRRDAIGGEPNQRRADRPSQEYCLHIHCFLPLYPLSRSNHRKVHDANVLRSVVNLSGWTPFRSGRLPSTPSRRRPPTIGSSSTTPPYASSTPGLL